jgi:hypothetical protein
MILSGYWLSRLQIRVRRGLDLVVYLLLIAVASTVRFERSSLWDRIELLITCVDAIVDDHLEHDAEYAWKEMIATASTAVLYGICRVQKLTPIELCASFC